MSKSLIAITGLIYAVVCIDQFLKGNQGMALAYFGYAISNIGLIFVAS